MTMFFYCFKFNSSFKKEKREMLFFHAPTSNKL
jgi:hypothetical protein